MRILHVLQVDDAYGSAKSFLELLEQEIKEPDITPFVVTPRKNKINSFCDANNIVNFTVPYGVFQIPKIDNWFIFIMKYIYHNLRFVCFSQKNVDYLCKIAKDNEITLIHSNSSIINVGAEIHKKTQIPHVWHLREFGREDYNFYSFKPNLTKYMNSNTNKFICISKALQKTWISKGVVEEKTVTIMHGINSKGFMRNKHDYDENLFKGVMCGSFSEAKGQLFLVQAIALLNEEEKKSIHIDLYGKPEGRYFEQVVQAIRQNGLEKNISIKGYSDNISEILFEYNIGFTCSRSEAMGRVTIEYMMAGLCPIASNTGANVEIVSDYECGLLYQEGDKDSLLRAIRSVLNDNELIKKYGEKSFKIAREYYDVNKNSKKIIQLFKEVESE